MRFFKRFIICIFYSTSSSVLLGSVAYGQLPNTAQPPSDSTLRYCVNPELLPVEGIDQHRHVGLTKSYINKLKSDNLTLKFVETSNPQQSVQFFKQGRCDLLPMASASLQQLPHSVLTDTYLTLRLAVLTNPLEKPLLPWLAHASYSELLSPWQLSGRIVNYLQGEKTQVTSLQQGISQVVNQHTDAFILPLESLQNLQKHHHIPKGLVINPLPFNNQYGMLVNQQIQKDIPMLEKHLVSVASSTNQQQSNPYSRLTRWISDYFWFWIGGLAIVVLFTIYRYYTMALHSLTLDSKNFELQLKNQELLRLQEQLHKRNEKLEYLSTYDMLTGLVNRNHFEERVKIELNRHNRNDSELSLILLDLDRFKAVNDNFGHTIGDKVLVSVAKILKQQVRNIDVVSRWGGEEFVILLPDTGIEEAANLAKRIGRAIANHEIEQVKHITCSIGVSQFNDEKNMDKVFIKADKALYRAKNQGRNRVECEY